MRSLAALVLVLILPDSGRADAWIAEDSLVRAWHRAHPQADADAHLLAGDSMRARINDCSAQLLGSNLLLRGWSMNPNSTPPNWRAQIALPEGCPTESARFHYQYAVMEYLEESWTQAAHHFNKARKLSSDSLFTQECHTSLAACYDKMTERRDSVLWHLEAALRLDPGPTTSPYLLNNIAGVYLDDLNGERALPFIQRALVQEDLPENLAFNLNMNLLNAQHLMGNMTEAAAVYESLKHREVTAGNRLIYVRLLAKYLLASDNYAEYCSMFPRLQGMLAGDTLTSGVAQWMFQPGRRLLNGDTLMEPIEPSLWAAIRWAAEQPIPPQMPVPQPPIQSEPLNPQVPALVALGLMGFIAGRWSNRLRRPKPTNARAEHPIISELIDQIDGDAAPEAMKKNLHKLDALWRLKHQETYRTIQPVEGALTKVEDQVLELIASGRTSKQIAQVLDLSVSYVYNVRTRLRKKLNVPDELQLEQWIHESTQ